MLTRQVNNEDIKPIELEIKNPNIFNPQAPAAQKTADEVVFRRFQSEGVAFF